MLNTELYIDGTRVDMFKDENIQITDTIQNARDIAKVFTTFSQSFTIPASKTNNKLFKHYHNPQVQSDFDARFQLPAEIRINGFNYKSGFIKLNDITLKDNKPYSYSVSFNGELANLNAIIKDTTLNSLEELDDYDHDYDLALVKDGVELGLAGSPMVRSATKDVIYPLITHTKVYEIDTSLTGAEMYDIIDNSGLEYDQLKPALKLKRIIEAIETKFGITFSTDFFGDSHFGNLYMWLCRNQGAVEGTGKRYTKFDICDLTWDAVDSDDIGNLLTCGRVYTNKFSDGSETQWTYTIEITSFTGTGNFTLYLYDIETGKTRLFQVYDDETVTGSWSHDFIQEEVGGGQTHFTPIISISSDNGITSMDHKVTVERRIYTTGGVLDSTETSSYTATIAPTVGEIQVLEQIPPQKVMDFLTGLFKMFNLTAYVKDDGDIYVDTLDNFYALGSDIDITEYVDISDSVVSPPAPYNELTFKYSKTTMLGGDKFFDFWGKEWGSGAYDLDVDYSNLGVGEYLVDVPFEHIMFDRLTEVDTGASSNVSMAFCINKDVESGPSPVMPSAPLIFYNSGTVSGSVDIVWSDTTTSTQFQRASNQSTASPFWSLNFDAENDEWSQTTNEDSLYSEFYEQYVTDTYGGGARLIRLTAYLPPKVILTYNLYDRIIINGQSHKINSIQIDLIDGKTELELITE